MHQELFESFAILSGAEVRRGKLGFVLRV